MVFLLQQKLAEILQEVVVQQRVYSANPWHHRTLDLLLLDEAVVRVTEVMDKMEVTRHQQRKYILI